MTSHELYQAELPAYIARRLQGEELARIEEHLQECDECRAIAGTWGELASEVRHGAETLFEPHVTEAELREFSLGRSGHARERIARHLAACASCALEVDVWRRQPGSNHRRRGKAATVAALSAAAGLVLGLGLALTAMRPGTGPSQPVGGRVQYIVIPASPHRGTADTITHRLTRNEGSIEIEFMLAPPRSLVHDAPYRIELRRATGELLWSTEMTMDALEQALQPDGVIGFSFPTTLIVPGRYECSIVSPGPAGEREARHVALEILPPE